MTGQAQTLVISDMDCFSFREPKSTGCGILWTRAVWFHRNFEAFYKIGLLGGEGRRAGWNGRSGISPAELFLIS